MPEVKIPVQASKIYYYCDECYSPVNNGVRLFNKHICLSVHPPKYIHYCPLCDKEFNLDKSYPSIEFIMLEE